MSPASFPRIKLDRRFHSARVEPYIQRNLNEYITRPTLAKQDGDSEIISIKDNIVTNNEVTTSGSCILKNHRSPFPAQVVARLGTLENVQISGKTNMDEFGMGSHSQNSYFGPVKNQHPFSHLSAGGSSGGSGVAVATKQARFALGTDTGGSIRLPAAYTNVVGFKPSYGSISRWGVVPYANSLDTVGVLGRKASEVWTVTRSLQNGDSQDPSCFPESFRSKVKLKKRSILPESPRSYKIGVPLEYNIEELDQGIRHSWQSLLEKCQALGNEIVPVSLPNTKHALSAYYVLAPAEAASNLSKYDGIRYGARREIDDGEDDILYSRTRSHGFGAEVKRRILLGTYTLSSKAIDNYYIKAQKVRRLVQRDFDRVFATQNPLHDEQFDLSEMAEHICLKDKQGPPQVDMIICPTAPTPPPSVDKLDRQSPIDAYVNDVFTVPSSLAGLPAISIPVAISEPDRRLGNPYTVGMQIIGQFWDDERVCAFASWIQEEVLPITDR